MRENAKRACIILFMLTMLINVSACRKDVQESVDIKTDTETDTSADVEEKVDEDDVGLLETERASDRQQEDVKDEEVENSAALSPLEVDEKIEDKAAYVYRDILDMYYQKISYGWDETEDVSYLFYWGYSPVKTLSDAGYAFVDLDNNGILELLVTSVEDAKYGAIYDLYTYVGGEVVHLFSSAERDMYHLCEDNAIYNENSGGAANSSVRIFGIGSDKRSLSLKEMVVYNEDLNQNNPWFYGTEESYNRDLGYNTDYLIGITGEEAQAIQDKYSIKNIELILFESYSPQGEMSINLKLKQALQEAVGSQNIVGFQCDDFDNDGKVEAFGMTGDSSGWNLSNSKIYFVNYNCKVECIDEIGELYGYGEAESQMEKCYVINTDNAKFVCTGGIDGQETFLYGVKRDSAYQPGVSGKHASFYKLENGLFIGEPHEGGTGEKECYYNFNSNTGEFEEVEID